MNDKYNTVDISVDFTTPKRKSNGDITPGFNGCHISLCSPFDLSQISSPEVGSEGKRGRPRSDVITSLMEKGAHSPSNIKCPTCARVFPRDKSLQAHMRTHTGEKPFHCTFPGCTKSFAQSGQLNTHSRLHSGEKPFQCTAEGCTSRFTHANRHCNDHPHAAIRRNPDENFVPTFSTTDISEEVLIWHTNFQKARDRTPKCYRNKREAEDTSNTPINNTLFTPPVKRNRSKRGLGPLMDQEQRLNMLQPSANYQYECPPPAHGNSSHTFLQIPIITPDKSISRRLMPNSPQEKSINRNSNSLFHPNSQEFGLEIDGIRPLDTDIYSYTHTDESPPSNILMNHDVGLSLNSYPFFPDQLCTGDLTPLKKNSQKLDDSLAIMKPKVKTKISGSEKLSAEVLTVPKVEFYKLQPYQSTEMINQNIPFVSVLPEGLTTKYKPKKKWLYATLNNKVNADHEEPLARVSTENTDTTVDHLTTKENKDTILGAIALVQLGKSNDDYMQPLNLSINNGSRK